MTVRTMRVLSLASVVGAAHTALRLAASAVTCIGDRSDGSDVEACADLADTRKRPVPSQLQFRRDQPVPRIDGVVLPERPIRAVACHLEIAHQSIADLIAATSRLRFGLDGRGCRFPVNKPQKSFLDGVVDA